MTKKFEDILLIAKQNVEHNPSIVEADTNSAVRRYIAGLIDEVREVEKEIKVDNEVYLNDELSDIAWDYATLLSVLENRGLISSAQDIFEYAHKKYLERTPAFLEGSQDLWIEIKEQQKKELKKKHEEKYGKNC